MRRDLAQRDITFGDNPGKGLASSPGREDRVAVHVQEAVRIQVDEFRGNVPGHVKVTNRVQRASYGGTRQENFVVRIDVRVSRRRHANPKDFNCPNIHIGRRGNQQVANKVVDGLCLRCAVRKRDVVIAGTIIRGQSGLATYIQCIICAALNNIAMRYDHKIAIHTQVA